MIVVFCGVPGSGKSTIAKCLAKILKQFGHVKLVVSDEIRGNRGVASILALREIGAEALPCLIE